ncbi:hypothetical protein BGZ46_000795 [Entomortierella lignicola]|nr:hypothetical protein BGZ46_000795 [Entomortierella lignicola]
MEQASSSETRVLPSLVELKLNCIVGEDTSAIQVPILSSSSVIALKDGIKDKKSNALKNIDANELTLYLVPDGGKAKSKLLPLLATPEELKENFVELENELAKLGTYFPQNPADDLVHIIVKLPERGKRGQVELGADESDELSSKRPRVDQDNLVNAVHTAGLAKKAMVGEDVDLTLLTSKELVSVLENIGVRAPRADKYQSIPRTASTLQPSSFDAVNYVISSPPRAKLPVIEARDLYVRQEFKDLYDTIIKQFCKPGDNEEETGVKPQNHIIVTGTAGIGKSSFLIYLAIRLLATSDTEDPPIVIIQRKEDSKCYAFGGLSSVRIGDIEDFSPFLDLPNTWFLVDSSPKPELTEARTIFSVSPKTLFSESNLYQEVVKRVVWTYYMAPWELDELRTCRNMVGAFQNIPEDFMEHLYDLIGGVPRYVLEKPGNKLRFNGSRESAEIEAYSRVKAALDNLSDPLRLLQYFEQAKDSLQFSSRLLHRYPTEDHQGFVLKWASAHIIEKVYEAADDHTWHMILERLVNGKIGEDRGSMFELYTRRMLRTGGCSFQARRLDGITEEELTITINANPKVKFFDTLEDYVNTLEGSLWFPKSKTFACVDFLIAPKILLQVTTNRNHGIKSEPFKELLKTLKDKKWICSERNIEFVFVVPLDEIEEFKQQTFRIGVGRLDPNPTQALLRIKQYILGIDLKAELTRRNTTTVPNNS